MPTENVQIYALGSPNDTYCRHAWHHLSYEDIQMVLQIEDWAIHTLWYPQNIQAGKSVDMYIIPVDWCISIFDNISYMIFHHLLPLRLSITKKCVDSDCVCGSHRMAKAHVAPPPCLLKRLDASAITAPRWRQCNDDGRAAVLLPSQGILTLVTVVP